MYSFFDGINKLLTEKIIVPFSKGFSGVRLSLIETTKRHKRHGPDLEKYLNYLLQKLLSKDILSSERCLKSVFTMS